MFSRINSFFPATVLSKKQGFTLIELLISVVLVAIVLVIILSVVGVFILRPSYKGTAYTVKDGQKYYSLVHLPEQGIIGGVCAGMAYKWGISPWIPRIGFIVFTCAAGAGILAYFLVWMLTDSAHTPNDYLQRTGG